MYVSAGVHGGQRGGGFPVITGSCTLGSVYSGFSGRAAGTPNHRASPMFYILSIQSAWIICLSS